MKFIRKKGWNLLLIKKNKIVITFKSSLTSSNSSTNALPRENDEKLAANGEKLAAKGE